MEKRLKKKHIYFQYLQVACKVKARYSSGKDWTMAQLSKAFFTGIKVKFTVEFV